MTPRAGIVVTGTEVLSGIIADRNGPWVSERLRELGVDAAEIVIVGDRPEDLRAALRQLAGLGASLIVTTGGLGPTADDLTAEVVAEFQGRPLALDEPLFGRIEEILRPLMARWPDLDPDAIVRSNKKQALVPDGATVLEPVGTAPGLIVPASPAGDAGAAGPTVIVLPGPPGELRPMWETAVAQPAFRAAIRDATPLAWRIMRLFGIPESEIAETLRRATARGLDLSPLEITTCLRRGEIEIATRYDAAAEGAYRAFEAFVADRHGELLFSTDGSTVDAQVAALLLRGPAALAEGRAIVAGQGRAGAGASAVRGQRGAGSAAAAGAGQARADAGASEAGGDGRVAFTIATAESCTGGLLAGRLTDRAGSSAYVLGGLVVYSNEAKSALAGVDPALIARVGAVSPEVAEALAAGAIARLGSDVGVGITGVAGPGGGTPEKPVGLVYVTVQLRDGAPVTRKLSLPGSRADIRDRTATVALHMVRRLLLHGAASSSGSVALPPSADTSV
jgi:nicotinamide-nucleotide amidase